MPPRSRGQIVNEEGTTEEHQTCCSTSSIKVLKLKTEVQRQLIQRRQSQNGISSSAILGSRITRNNNILFLIPIPATSFTIFLFFIVFLSRLGECCMPGYEQERARLRQYLGIEWIPKGLAKMDAEKPRFVRHANELNCDFSKPDNCMWQNVHGALDSLDFYLFRKEDNTEFPVFQIRPGPSKLPTSDQLLLVGDKRRQEQSAILTSHPIKCQNTTGKLTLTFWLYNGPRVEVLILEDREEGLLVQLPEKPQIDCGTVQMNTECTVLIPPRDQPFHIGIRAYDIKNPEGSFVMLDNLLYEAQFCRVPIDFGDGFHSEPLLTGANGLSIKTVQELECHEFDSRCHWRNLGHGERGIWRRAMGEPPSSAMLFNKTGTYLQPTLPAAFLYIEEGNQGTISSQSNQHHGFHDASTSNELYRILASDPIQCLNSPVITLQFSIWSTKGIQLSCCLLDPQTMRVLDSGCQSISTARSPAPIQHHFHPPDSPAEFVFAILVDNVNSDFDNFVILDDFELIAPEASRCGMLGIHTSQHGSLLDSVYTAPMLSSLLNRPIHSAKDLFCDFSKRGLNCQWANLDRLTEGMSPWEIGILEIAHKQQRNKFLPTPTQNNILLPDGDLAITRLDTLNDSAVLLSETIQCVLGRYNKIGEENDVIDGGTLSFRSWRSGPIELEICIVRANTLEVLDCETLYALTLDEQQKIQQQEHEHDGRSFLNSNGEQVLVDIPRLDEPVRLAFRAVSRGEHGGRVAIDDINFEGNICAATNAIAFASKSGHNNGHHQQQQADFNGNSLSAYQQQNLEDSNKYGNSGWHSLPDENVCRLLSCDFQRENNICLYSSSRIASSVSMFRAYNKTAFAMLFTRSRVAMLESPIFHINAPARLHFDFAISKGKANLHVCQDSVKRELANCSAVFTAGQTDGWKHDFVEIMPTDRKLYLITKLEDPTGKASIQLDNLQLTDVDNHLIC